MVDWLYFCSAFGKWPLKVLLLYEPNAPVYVHLHHADLSYVHFSITKKSLWVSLRHK